jgi:hypothetical protein
MGFHLCSCVDVVLTVLLVNPTWLSRHGFWAQRPLTSLSLISHSPKYSSPLLVALMIELVDVPFVDPLCIVHLSSLAYFCASDEAQHCLDTGLTSSAGYRNTRRSATRIRIFATLKCSTARNYDTIGLRITTFSLEYFIFATTKFCINSCST